jgi:hypothetical protein
VFRRIRLMRFPSAAKTGIGEPRVPVPMTLGASHSSFLSGRSISSYVGTWVLFHHDSSAAPQTVQTASPVCGTKNFCSVRLYQRRNCIEQLSPSPEDAPRPPRFPALKTATIKLTHYRGLPMPTCPG